MSIFFTGAIHKFPLIKLAKKLKELDKSEQDLVYKAFPLIKLAKKLKVVDGEGWDHWFSPNGFH